MLWTLGLNKTIVDWPPETTTSDEPYSKRTCLIWRMTVKSGDVYIAVWENGGFNVGRNLESYSLVLSTGYVAPSLPPVPVCLYAGP